MPILKNERKQIRSVQPFKNRKISSYTEGDQINEWDTTSSRFRRIRIHFELKFVLYGARQRFLTEILTFH